MSLKKKPTPIESVLEDIDKWIKKTTDEQAKFPLHAAREIVKSKLEYEMKFAGKMYDHGASAKYPYETGLKFVKEKYK